MSSDINYQQIVLLVRENNNLVKKTFENCSYHISGNFIIIVIPENINIHITRTITTNKIFDLSNVESFRTHL